MNDITASLEYAQFIKAYYGMETAFEHGLPVHYKNGEVHIPFREYLVPGISLSWMALCKKIKEQHHAEWLELRVAGVPLAGGLEETPFAAFFLDLSGGEAAVLERMNKKTRNEVRKGQMAGFTIEHLHDASELTELYLENMGRHGTPAKSRDYFPKFLETMGARVAVIGARQDGVLAGANVLLVGDTDARVLMNLSRKTFWPEYVNNLLYGESIRYALSKNFTRLDFGGGLASDTSHNHFKAGFGARQVPIYGITLGSPLKRLQKYILRKKRNFLLRF